MKKFLLLAFFALLFSFSFAEESLVIQAKVTVFDGNVAIDDIHVVHGTPGENDAEGRHIAKLLDKDLETLYQLRFYLEKIEPTLPETIPPEHYEEFIKAETSYEALIFFPYFEEAELIAIGEIDGNLLGVIGLKGILCNGNGLCDDGENFLSCPGDCPLQEEDNYCYPESDGICDPDCITGLDADCGAMPGDENGKGKEPFNWLAKEQGFFLSAIAITIVALAALAVFFRKKKK